MVTIEERLLQDHNRYHRPMIPRGLVAHSTANPNASAEVNWAYYNSRDAGASVHYFVDDVKAIRCVPEEEQGGHVGNAWLNRTYIGVELCETTDPAKFAAGYANYVDLLADICRRHKWNSQTILTHNEVSCVVPEDTDHLDPTLYLGKGLGITPTAKGVADRLRADVQAKLDAASAPLSVTVLVDGTNVDCAARLENSRTVGILRPVIEAVGGRVGWSQATRTLSVSTRHLL